MTAPLHISLSVAILPAYILITVLIGWRSRRRATDANDYLNASRSLPLWIVTSAFVAANCGALEIIGLSAMAAQYGVQAFQFYWIGAIPAMIFLGYLMIPIYMRSGVRSLPEYLEKRFDGEVRLMYAWLIVVSVIALSGISLYAIGQVLSVVFGWSFSHCTMLAAGVVLIYVLLGGIRATIYNEVFQLLVIVAGLLPLLLSHRALWMDASRRLATQHHLWIGVPAFSPAAKLDQFGVIVGLGLVLSFGYWCTDFVLMQRALTAKTVQEGRLVPVLAGFGKLGFSFLVVLPAMGAATLLGRRMPASFDQTLPALMVATYGPVLLSLGVTAILASMMSGFAANISAFSAVWTEEIYRKSLKLNAAEEHYVHTGGVSAAVAVVLSVATSYIAFSFHNLMEYVQLIFSLFNAPIFAIFILGIFTRRATPKGAKWGLLIGVSFAVAHHILAVAGRLVYGSQMNADFHVAAYACAVTLLVGLFMSRPSGRKSDDQLERCVYTRVRAEGHMDESAAPPSAMWWILASLLLGTCVVLNYLWR